MEKLFEIKTKYTLDEHMKFNFAIAKKSKELWIVVALWLLVLIGGIIARESSLVIFAIIFPIMYFAVIWHTAKKNYSSNKAAQDAEMTIEFYKDKMIQISDVGSYTIEHDKIARIIETKAHFYVMISKIQGVILPKENMPEELISHIRAIKV